MSENIDQQDVCLCQIIQLNSIAAARSSASSPTEQNSLWNLFKAMGDKSRLNILQTLGEEEMCVCYLACLLEVSESAGNHQRRLLQQLNLVAIRRVGPILCYRLGDQHIEQLLAIGLEHIRE
ncbi:MAG: helix-turn-helix transcriptional regulator [Desulfobulbaceae bacterium]|nr:helix-turn-helix transcriptional regulator [Desulfobulbaceae bacterium]